MDFDVVQVGDGPWCVGDRAAWKMTAPERPVLVFTAPRKGYALGWPFVSLLMRDLAAGVLAITGASPTVYRVARPPS